MTTSRQTIGALFCYAALCSAGIALAEEQDPVKRFVSRLESERAVVFISDCQDDDIKMFVLFRVGETGGFYAQVKQDPVITINLGEIAVENGTWRVTATTGGLVSGRPGGNDRVPYETVVPYYSSRSAPRHLQ